MVGGRCLVPCLLMVRPCVRVLDPASGPAPKMPPSGGLTSKEQFAQVKMRPEYAWAVRLSHSYRGEMTMRRFMLITLVLAALLASTPAAFARGGFGHGFDGGRHGQP